MSFTATGGGIIGQLAHRLLGLLPALDFAQRESSHCNQHAQQRMLKDEALLEIAATVPDVAIIAERLLPLYKPAP